MLRKGRQAKITESEADEQLEEIQREESDLRRRLAVLVDADRQREAERAQTQKVGTLLLQFHDRLDQIEAGLCSDDEATRELANADRFEVVQRLLQSVQVAWEDGQPWVAVTYVFPRDVVKNSSCL